MTCYISNVAPTGMVFIPCADGLSHNEAEAITYEHAVAGAEVTLAGVLRLGRNGVPGQSLTKPFQVLI